MAVHPRLRAAAGNREIRVLAVAVVVELCLLAVYFAATPAQVTQPRYVLYPFVWINVSLWVTLGTDPPPAPRRRVRLALAVSLVYLVVLIWLAGLVGLTLGGAPTELLGVNVSYGSPGWERVRVVTPAFYVTLVPFRVVGFLALAYLVYVTVLDASAAAASGALGVFACLGCSFPIVASLATGIVGVSSPLVGTLYAHSVDLSTAVFLLAVGLLYYRPGFEQQTRRPVDRD